MGTLSHAIVGTAQTTLMIGADAWAESWPAPRPTRAQAAAAKIVAHRGAHGPQAPENTIAAFDRADDAGVWGLECDVRFTRDHEVVVCHDRDLRRVFGLRLEIADAAAGELRAQAPAIPRLEELVERYGRRRHLMIEAKADGLPKGAAIDAFREALKGLEPGRDWSLLGLRPEIFESFAFVPPEARVLVAETRPGAWSRAVLDNGWGALAGHFVMIHDRLRARHRARGQKIGVGHVASANSLRRELARGADWLFANRAVEAQAWLAEAQANLPEA